MAKTPCWLLGMYVREVRYSGYSLISVCLALWGRLSCGVPVFKMITPSFQVWLYLVQLVFVLLSSLHFYLCLLSFATPSCLPRKHFKHVSEIRGDAWC